MDHVAYQFELSNLFDVFQSIAVILTDMHIVPYMHISKCG